MKSIAVLSFALLLLADSSFGILPLERFGWFRNDALRAHEVCKARTGVSERLIDAVKSGYFPDNEPAIMQYNFCIWSEGCGLTDDYRFRQDRFYSILNELKAIQDYNQYNYCYDYGLRSCGSNVVTLFWEMQKCLYKTLPAERFFYY